MLFLFFIWGGGEERGGCLNLFTGPLESPYAKCYPPTRSNPQKVFSGGGG